MEQYNPLQLKTKWMQCFETKYLIPYHFMEDLLRLKPKWIQYIDKNEFITYILMSASSVTSFDSFLWFLSSKNYQKKKIIPPPFFLLPNGTTGTCFMLGVVIPLWRIPYFSSFPIIISYVRNLFCCSIIKIMLMLVIMIRLIIRRILLSKIIMVWNWCFTSMPSAFWFYFIRAVLLMLYEH